MRNRTILRNIPAHAGKTPSNLIFCSMKPEHPRARGENPFEELTPEIQAGTSPRTRGKLCQSAGTPRLHRNIPAHAGKTTSPALRSFAPRNIPAHAGKTAWGEGLVWGDGEHPRARGENVCFGGRRWVGWGTSPRTRGKLEMYLDQAGNLRNIPAHAGKTHRTLIQPGARWEHPRARGENKSL